MGDQRAACPNGALHDDLAGEMDLFMLVNEGGLIVKTAGDGVLVEFPTAVDAICNAVEIQHGRARQRDAEPIQLRTGINVGEIIVEVDDIR